MNVYARFIGGYFDGRVFEIDSSAEFWELNEYPPLSLDFSEPLSCDPISFKRHIYKIRSRGNDYYDAIWVRPQRQLS
jgi:hypothetical protein